MRGTTNFGVALIGAAIVGFSAPADAGPKKVKVKVSSDPPGASVYLNSKEAGAVCTTPCEVPIALGEDASLIVEKEKFEPAIESVDVPKTAPKKQLVVQVKLEASVSYLNVEGSGSAKGGTIQVDGIDVGTAPKRVEIEAGTHLLSVTSTTGASLYDGTVEVNAGEEKTITPTSVATGDPATPSEGPDGDKPAIVKGTKPSKPRNRFVAVSVAADVGFRSFSYDNVTKGNLRDESEGGQVMVGPIVELWPTELFGIDALHGLSVYGRFQLGTNNQTVTGDMIESPTKTKWRSLDVSVKQRWTFADTVGVEIGAGYIRDQYEFSGLASDIAQVPDVDYRGLRIGAKLAMVLGSVEPYLAAENRIVFEGGDLGKRLTSPTTSGLHGALGVAYTSGWFCARLEGSLTQYKWTFKPNGTDANQATGASDVISSAGITLGAMY